MVWDLSLLSTTTTMEHLDEVLCRIPARLDLNGEINSKDLELTAEGRGAYSDVFRGYWKRGDRCIAAKKLRFFMKNDVQILKRLAKEVYIWSQLDHVNVLPLLGFFFEDDIFPVFVSEWMGKGTLNKYMPSLGRGMELVEMARGIAAGLEYLHSQHVIHADLKSFNILVSPSGQPLLADFGVSELLAATLSKLFGTTTVSTKGTVRWMAYELLSVSEVFRTTPSEKSDIWAFGMTIYEILTLDLPYSHLNDVQATLQISKGKYPNHPRPSEKKTLPIFEQKLWDICFSCWRKDPEMRPTAHDILSDIRAIQEEKPLPSEPKQRRRMKIVRGGLSVNEDALKPLSYDIPSTNSKARGLSQVSATWKAFEVMNDWCAGDAKRLEELSKESLRGDDWFTIFNPRKTKYLGLKLMRTLQLDSVVPCVRFSPDGRFLAVCSMMSVNIYNTYTGERTSILLDITTSATGDSFIRGMSFNRDGKYLAAASEDKLIRVWEIAEKRVSRVFKGHEQEVYSIAFSQDECFVASGSGDGTVRIWDMVSDQHQVFEVLDSDGDAGVTSVAISPDSTLVAAGILDSTVCIWHVGTGDLIERLHGHADSTYTVLFTPDGKGLVSGSLDSTLMHWDITPLTQQLEEGRLLPLSNSVTSDLKVNEDTDVRATKDNDGENASTLATEYGGHKSFVLTAAISHDGRWIVSGSYDLSVQFWKPQDPDAHMRLIGHTNMVLSVDVSSKDGYFATGGADGLVRIWQYTTDTTKETSTEETSTEETTT